MADLYNLLGDIRSDEDDDDDHGAAMRSTVDNDDDDEQQQDRERLDLPPALAEAERKQYQHVQVEKDDDDDVVQEEDGLEEDADYAKLKHLWKQEMNSPELMPYDAETIGLLSELLEGQEATIDKLNSGDASSRSNDVDPALAPLLASIYKMDADRVRFMMTDLTRTRLDKIEKHPLYMRGMVDHMSDDEISYLKQYGELMERHLRRTVLDHLPKEAWKTLDEPEMIDRPNMDEFVFCKVLETVEINNRGPMGDEDDDEGDDIQEHKKGDCLIARYSVVRDLVLAGKIEMLL